MKGLKVLVLLVILSLVGCNTSEEIQQGEKKPETVHNVFLMYEEEYVEGEFGQQSIGKLYLVSEDTEIDKVASDVKDGYFYYGKLYLMENMKEKKMIFDDLASFSTASYHNEQLYRNEIQFEDIAGVWRYDELDGTQTFIEIGTDGTFYNFASDFPGQLEKENYSGYNELQAYFGDYPISFSPCIEKSLVMDYQDQTFHLLPSSKEEVEKYHAKLQLEADQYSIQQLMEAYITNFERAENYGVEGYITDYMDPTSPMYVQQINFVLTTYEKDIREKLIDYTITDISPSTNGSYVVTTNEIYTIYVGYDGTGSTKAFTNTYVVRNTNGEFSISDIKSKQADSGV